MYAQSTTQVVRSLHSENFSCKEVTLKTVLPILVIFALGTSLLGWQTQNTQISLIQEHAVCLATAPLAAVSLKDIFFTKALAGVNASPTNENVEGAPSFEHSFVKAENLAAKSPTQAIQKESIEILPLAINAPSPGRCEHVFVKPGDFVVRGSALCEMESMKMYYTLRSSKEGKVKEVFVQPLKEVRANDVLFFIEVS